MSRYRVTLAARRKKGEKSIFYSSDSVLEGAAMCTASYSRLESVHRLRYFLFCTYICIWSITTYRVYRHHGSCINESV